jgi:hypothetical protein
MMKPAIQTEADYLDKCDEHLAAKDIVRLDTDAKTQSTILTLLVSSAELFEKFRKLCGVHCILVCRIQFRIHE